ncbi:expressed unknown protein [Seminavis robusta]|uniref:Uncharacterized protein n=1 Tax=Seminavis robusta TaxID=568900 RepID=A0A9N8EAU2_9STRA|nr:expressed unknown protein [Seminavis robusta]|eukprot:Sro815_g206590.1 n/a (484) ;mRNA; f:45034-46485
MASSSMDHHHHHHIHMDKRLPVLFALAILTLLWNGCFIDTVMQTTRKMESKEDISFSPLSPSSSAAIAAIQDVDDSIIKQPADARIKTVVPPPAIKPMMKLQPRVYPRRSRDTFPCFLDDNSNSSKSHEWRNPPPAAAPVQEGFFFLKTHKTGSSTSAGVHIRIARNMATYQTQRWNKTTTTAPSSFSTTSFCRAQFDHSTARKMNYGQRSKSRSFLWTILREPNQRAKSHFFHFGVSRRNIPPDQYRDFLLNKNHKKKSTNNNDKGYYVKMLSTSSSLSSEQDETNNNTTTMIAILQDILDSYDFIAITERMEESIVALQMILGLSTADVLYLSAKSSGGYDAGGGFGGKCILIQKPHKESLAKVEQFMRESPEWKAHVQWDQLLYQAANQSLDRTIHAFDQDEFRTHLALFRHAQQVAQEQCLPHVRLPCSKDREAMAPLPDAKTDCLWKDSACGTACLDQVANQLGLWAHTNRTTTTAIV